MTIDADPNIPAIDAYSGSTHLKVFFVLIDKVIDDSQYKTRGKILYFMIRSTYLGQYIIAKDER